MVNKNQEKAIFITGASGGIGTACTLALARSGFRVFAGVRQLEDGEALKQLAPERITPIIIDVTDRATIESARSRVEKTILGQGLYGLVNNAGILVSAPMEYLPLEDFRHQLEVNVIGQVAMIQAFLPAIRTARGRIVNISSVSGLVAFPFTGAYCASKFALEAITDSLRLELQPWGIPVIAIEPPFVKTAIWDKAVKNSERSHRNLSETCEQLYGSALRRKQSKALEEVDRAMSSDRVAQTLVRAFSERVPKTRYLIGKDAYLSAIASLLPDRLRDRFIRQYFHLDR